MGRKMHSGPQIAEKSPFQAETESGTIIIHDSLVSSIDALPPLANRSHAWWRALSDIALRKRL